MKRYWAIIKAHGRGPRIAGLVAASLAALVLVLAGEARNRPVFDFYQNLHPRPIRTTDVHVVLIDDAAVEAVGSWPWPRYAIARLLEGIASRQPKVIGVDMLFPEPDRNNPATFASIYPELSEGAAKELVSLPSMDSFLAEVVGNTPTILAVAGTNNLDGRSPNPKPAASEFDPRLPASILSYPSELATIAPVRDQAISEGLINGLTDPDGTSREIQMAAHLEGRDVATLSLEMLRQSKGGKPIRPVRVSGRLTRLDAANVRIPVDPTGAAKLWFGRLPDSAFHSAVEFLGEQPPEDLRGKYVFVAVTAAGTTDIVSIPNQGRTFGVDIHAQALDAMLKDQLLERPLWAGIAEWATAALLVAAALLASNRIRRRMALAIPLAIAILVMGSSFGAFVIGRLLIDPVVPLGVGASSVSAIALLRFFEVARAREAIHQAFDRYLSPDLVSRIAKDPSLLELGGEERDMTVLFCDVRGFSSISEGLSPDEIIQFLIGLLTPMTDILLAGKATIDKYVGDAIIAFWNAPLDDPRHAQNAADTALAMTRRLVELNRDMPNQSRYPWPGEVKIGIGLNAGLVCVGNMGSERRLNYSMIGDTVNLASRIEGLTKFYGVEIAIGEGLAKRLTDYAIVEADLVRVVGRDTPETIWLLLGDPEMAASRTFHEIKLRLDELLESYRKQDWERAKRLIAQRPATDITKRLSKLFSIYSDRIASLEGRGLPGDWDGVYQAQEK